MNKEIRAKIKEAFDKALQQTEYGYVVSWWLANNLSLKTSQVNRVLKKYVSSGELHFVATPYSTKFYPSDTKPAMNEYRITSTSDPRFQSGIAIKKEG